MQWIQSPSDYNSIVAAKFSVDWANFHQPVILTHKHGHEVYIKFHYEKPEDKVYYCPSGCARNFKPWFSTQSSVCLTCLQCGKYRATIGRGIPPGPPLGLKSLIRTKFPRELLVIGKWD